MKKEKDPLENTADWKGGQPGMYRKGNQKCNFSLITLKCEYFCV